MITGDLVDFNTYKNYDVAKELLAGKDYMFCAGNHEFTPKPGTDSMELKRGSWDYIQSHFRGNMHIESRIVGGVNIIWADNGFRLLHDLVAARQHRHAQHNAQKRTNFSHTIHLGDELSQMKPYLSTYTQKT